MSKVERTTFCCAFHLIIHLEQNQKGGGVHLIHSSLFSRNILWTYIDVVHVTCVVIRQALFSLCIFPRGQQLPTQTHGTLCQRGFLFNINAATTKDLCPSRFCASFIYGAKNPLFIFFHKKRICTKFNWFHPRATSIIHAPPNSIHYKYKLYGSH